MNQSVAIAANQDVKPCPFCGSSDLSLGLWSLEQGEVDSNECNNCLGAAPVESWQRETPALQIAKLNTQEIGKPVFHNQLVTNHNPDKGIYGDCFRTCVANYLGAHPLMVPAPDNNGKTVDPVKEWLSQFGLSIIYESYAYDEDNPNWIHWFCKTKSSGQPYILSGRHASNSVNHACLYKDGELLHDPSGRDGLHYPVVDDDGTEFYMIEHIIYKSIHHRPLGNVSIGSDPGLLRSANGGLKNA